MSEQASKTASQAEEQKLSPAELKKRAKAEKQARRAAQKEQQGPGGNSQDTQTDGAIADQGARKQDGVSQQGGAAAQRQQGQRQKGGQQKQADQTVQQDKSNHKRTASQTAPLPIRHRHSQSGGTKPMLKKQNKQVELFSHLYTQPRRHTLEGISKDVHPAVLALGFQMSSYEICGSSARCVAMLLAFKETIQAYTTPAGTSLARHMTSHCLSPQIDFLKSCRPISESMGNAIRFLKKLIVEIDPSVEEQEAKNFLCEQIGIFIRDRIIVTDQAIASSASGQIRDGAVILTYAKSALVEQTILKAHSQGKKFRVIVVDSRPLFEGKNLARTFMRAGIRVEYTPHSGLTQAVREATIVLLGAHSMLSNGRLQSRVGTASVALQAHKADIPVIVLCESVKFTGKVALDSIVLNEVAPSDELLVPLRQQRPVLTSSGDGKQDDDATEDGKDKSLEDWRDIANLQILNLMYDVTPAEYIRMVICEYGSLPPSSVPVVHRLANEGM